MLEAIPLMGHVLVLCCFVFTVFGIFAVSAFGGVLKRRCVYVGSPVGANVTSPPPEILTWRNGESELVCSVDSNTAYGHGPHCPSNYACENRENPEYGLVSFDNLGIATLTIFQCITLEQWTDIMYMSMDATTKFASLYFILLVFIGSFFVVNLALAVISNIYDCMMRTHTD